MYSTAVQTLAVIPAHDEAETLADVVKEIRTGQPGLEILVVDDASTDGSGELVSRLGVRWLQLTQHIGLGGAMRAGLRYARMLGFEAVLRLDADGQHCVEHAETMLAPLESGEADAVVGSRFSRPSGYRNSWPRAVVHRALALCLSQLVRRKVTDPTSGFWAFGPRALRLLGDHHPRGFSEPELLLFLARNRLRVVEVPVSMRARQGGSPSLTIAHALLALARTGLAMMIVPLRSKVSRKRHA